MNVKRDMLLFLACLVWSAAGINILRIGLIVYPAHLTAANGLLSALVFAVFQRFVFGRLVRKHTARIRAYPDEPQFFLKFFDGQSFAVMALMMTGGLALRSSGLAPERFIAVFYTGLGASLLLAGLRFGYHFGEATLIATKDEHTKTIDHKGEMNMKRYMDAALAYAVLAMVGGVFYREFTKFNGFTSKTALGVVHTHYFLLGMVAFLLLVLLEKQFSFTDAKTRRVLLVYHIGLNLAAFMLAVRGVTQVLGTALSSGMSAAISGIAGVGHILLGVSLVLLLVQIRRSVSQA